MEDTLYMFFLCGVRMLSRFVSWLWYRVYFGSGLMFVPSYSHLAHQLRLDNIR